MKQKVQAFLQRILKYIKTNKKKSAIAFILLVVYYFSLPRTLFEEPYSTVIESNDGELLAAKIARDGQWRFPAKDSIPYKFKKCIKSLFVFLPDPSAILEGIETEQRFI